MTSDGSPYGRFQKALKTGNVNLALAAARELPTVNRSDSGSPSTNKLDANGLVDAESERALAGPLHPYGLGRSDRQG
jgi:hypothetical protein